MYWRSHSITCSVHHRLSHSLSLSLSLSPCLEGGSFSNWWCSVFNVDLALSVALTTISTACSVFMLPLNLFVYARLAYGHSVQVTPRPRAIQQPWFK
jgi:predicted Na+-dependent transporter